MSDFWIGALLGHTVGVLLVHFLHMAWRELDDR